jgi:hypothetical protein
MNRALPIRHETQDTKVWNLPSEKISDGVKNWFNRGSWDSVVFPATHSNVRNNKNILPICFESSSVADREFMIRPPNLEIWWPGLRLCLYPKTCRFVTENFHVALHFRYLHRCVLYRRLFCSPDSIIRVLLCARKICRSVEDHRRSTWAWRHFHIITVIRL